MTEPAVLYERQGSTAFIRLNRPHRLNAVIEALYEGVVTALDTAEKDPDVRVVVLTGVGRAFCAGADMKAHAEGGRTRSEREAYFQLGNAACRRLYTLRQPVIAAVNGYAIGAGAELAIACDFILMTESAEIGLPEIALGSHVGGAVTMILPRLIGLAKARELMFRGERIDGKEAKRVGLAMDAYPESDFVDRVQEFAGVLASKAPIPMAHLKAHLNQGYTGDLDAVLDSELQAIHACVDTEDWREAIDAFAARRTPVFTGR